MFEILYYTVNCIFELMQDTCTGFLLGGVGELDKNRRPNFCVVDKSKKQQFSTVFSQIIKLYVVIITIDNCRF